MPKDKEQSKWFFFLDNSKVTFIIVALVVIVGLVSIIRMPKESSPEVDFPFAIVTTILPGASAEEVEELVTDVLESRILSLEKIDTVNSSSQPGISTISVLFEVNENGDEMVTKLRDRLDGVSVELPADSEEPVISKISLTDLPVLVFALSGSYNEIELRTYAENLQDEIENIKFVSRVEIVGAPKKEILVLLRREALAQYNLNVNEIVTAISNANSVIPIGSISANDEIYALKINSQIKSVNDLNDLSILTSAGNTIFLRNLATISEVYNNNGSLSRLTKNQEETTSAVSMYVYKSPGGNILEVAGSAKKLVDESIGKSLPSDVVVSEIENMAEYIRTDLSNLLYGGLATMMIVFTLLLLFVGLREAIIASVGIPLTFFISFIVLFSLDYSINFLTLFSLILALGILVDSSIVVTEGVYQNLKRGKTPLEAAYDTISEFGLPLISGTLTTIFVFLPMLFMTGIMGKFIKSIPVTVTTVLLASLFVALGVLPALAVKLLKNLKTSNGEIISQAWLPTEKYFDRWSKKYENLLTKILSSAKLKKQLFWSLIGGFIVAILLPVVGLVSVNMFPAEALETFYIDIENPIGTTLEQTKSNVEKVEDILRTDDRLDTILARVGQGNNALNESALILNINPKSRDSSLDLVAEYDQTLKKVLPNSQVKVYQNQSGPTQEAPVQVRLVGESLIALNEASQLYLNLLSSIPGTVNVRTNSPKSNGEFVIILDQTKTKAVGLDPLTVSSFLRTAITGREATVLKTNSDDIEVIVAYQLNNNKREVLAVPEVDLSLLESLIISSPTGKKVSLASIATIELKASRQTIAHEGGERIITVMSDVASGYTSASILKEFEKGRQNIDLPSEINVKFGGEAEDIAESFIDLGQAMIIGIFMIFALLVWQFKSYRQPIFILVTIPLSLIGVFFGLLIVRQPLSFPGFIGVVALAGIVVNNAIILMDRINLNRHEEGMDKMTAIIEGAKSRLQPIFLTTITTVLGILPLALTNPVWGPLGYSIVFGLSFSTLLTLVVIPLLYQKFER